MARHYKNASLLSLLLVTISAAYAENAPDANTDVTPGTAPPATTIEQQPVSGNSDANADNSWIDGTHNYVANSAHGFANWIDHFFGTSRDDIESAYSSLRLTFEEEWEEGNGRDGAVRLRGKVHLPRINERLSLIFTDEEGEISEADENLKELNNDTETTRLALQYKAKEKKRSRLDYRLGLRSSLKVRASARYRYQFAEGENINQRFTQTLFFIDGEGVGSRSQYELDYLPRESYLLRWSNTAKYTENSNGVEWSTRVTLGQRRNDKSALALFAWTAGDTRPVYLTTSYGLGARYRRNFARPWLFFELEPAYLWRREAPEDDREGLAVFTARLEILFERLVEKE